MNIFALDQEPAVAAKYHCDKHVVKMPVESAQMMATIIRQTLPKKVVAKHPSLFKSSHPEHPCTVWARTTVSNYEWLKQLSLALIQEHEYRYGLFRESLWDKIVSWPNPDLPPGELTPFALAIPEWIREVGLKPVQSYRLLYCSEKLHLLKYKRRSPPPWIPQSVLSVSQRLRIRYPRLIRL